MSSFENNSDEVNKIVYEQMLSLYYRMRQAYLNDDQKELDTLKKRYPGMFAPEMAKLLRGAYERYCARMNKHDPVIFN